MSDIIRLQDRERFLKQQSERRQAVLLIDGSDSMTDSKKRLATEGAFEFSCGAVKKNYSVGAIGFSTDAQLICKPTTDLEHLRKACACYPVSGMTFIGAGLVAARKLNLKSGDVVVVVTDGQCGKPSETLSIAASLKAEGIEILAIGTDDADQSFLQRLASRPDLGLKVALGQFKSAITNASRLLPDRKSASDRDKVTRSKK